jgi:hypothetical protein
MRNYRKTMKIENAVYDFLGRQPEALEAIVEGLVVAMPLETVFPDLDERSCNKVMVYLRLVPGESELVSIRPVPGGWIEPGLMKTLGLMSETEGIGGDGRGRKRIPRDHGRGETNIRGEAQSFIEASG